MLKKSKKKQKNRLQHHDVHSFGIMLVVRKKYKTTPGKTIWYVRYVINMATTTLVDMSSDSDDMSTTSDDMSSTTGEMSSIPMRTSACRSYKWEKKQKEAK